MVEYLIDLLLLAEMSPIFELTDAFRLQSLGVSIILKYLRKLEVSFTYKMTNV